MPPIVPSLDSLTQGAVAFPVAIALVALAALVLSILHARSERRWGALLRGADGGSLESLLQEHLAERVRLEAEIESLMARVRRLETEGRKAKRHVGLVRFDAFDEIGGEQSFALALLDDRGDGLVVTSIVGRESARTFAKAIVGGRSERTLMGEEVRAVREAVGGEPRAVVGV